MNLVHARIAPILVSLFAAAGCISDASVQFKGTVTLAKESGHSFDDRPNPAAMPPVANADVRLYVDLKDISCDRAEPSMIAGDETSTRSDGSYQTREATFSGMLGQNIRIMICVTGTDFEVYEYQTVLQHTTDPVHAEKFLNIRVRR